MYVCRVRRHYTMGGIERTRANKRPVGVKSVTGRYIVKGSSSPLRTEATVCRRPRWIVLSSIAGTANTPRTFIPLRLRLSVMRSSFATCLDLPFTAFQCATPHTGRRLSESTCFQDLCARHCNTFGSKRVLIYLHASLPYSMHLCHTPCIFAILSTEVWFHAPSKSEVLCPLASQ